MNATWMGLIAAISLTLGLPVNHEGGSLSRDERVGVGQANPAAQRRPEAAIRELLDRQVEAWNRGDVEAFMAGYWRSDETSFSGTNGVTRGWQGLLDRYKRNYPDRKTMGTLQFQKLEITPLCADAAMILGEWHLQREKPVGGVFTLVARRFPEGWKIIHDHTDSVVPQNQ